MSSSFEKALKTLENKIPEYIKKVGRFQYKNQAFRLVDHYIASEYKRCDICGHRPIKEVFVIQDSRGNTLNVGNICINKITNQKIAQWFKDIHNRIETLKNNEYAIGTCELLLNQKLVFISAIGRKRLRTMLKRMLDGRKPTQKQVKLLIYYAHKYNDALRARRTTHGNHI